MSTHDASSIRARCLCSAHTFTASVPTSSLPLNGCVCHCDSCRHLTGSLYFADVPWPRKDEDLSALKCYSTSPNTDIFSCGTCATQLFCRSINVDHGLCVLTGALDNTPGLLDYDEHIFVGDTRDGGASMWLRERSDGKRVRRWRGRIEQSEELTYEWPDGAGGRTSPEHSAAATAAKAGPELTPLWCHCRGVSLWLKSGVDLISDPDNGPPQYMDKYMDKITGKYVASIDACDSCRLAFGSDLICWTFVPLHHISSANPSAGPDSSQPEIRTITDLREAVSRGDPRLGTLSRYSSSEGVDRYFCSTCSASIFYATTRRPEQVDIAVGVLQHPDGARAEELLDWQYKEIDFVEDIKGGWREELARTVLKEAQNWNSKRSEL